MIIPSVDGGGKGCMSPRNFVRCAHQHSSTHHYAHHLKNNAVEKQINCQSSPWFPQQKLKIRTASQCNTIVSHKGIRGLGFIYFIHNSLSTHLFPHDVGTANVYLTKKFFSFPTTLEL